METFKRMLGDEHPNTLTSTNNLAFTWKVRADTARRLGSISLAQSTRTLCCPCRR